MTAAQPDTPQAVQPEAWPGALLGRICMAAMQDNFADVKDAVAGLPVTFPGGAPFVAAPQPASDAVERLAEALRRLLGALDSGSLTAEKWDDASAALAAFDQAREAHG